MTPIITTRSITTLLSDTEQNVFQYNNTQQSDTQQYVFQYNNTQHCNTQQNVFQYNNNLQSVTPHNNFLHKHSAEYDLALRKQCRVIKIFATNFTIKPLC